MRRLALGKEEKDYIIATVRRQLFAYLFCALLLREFKEKETGMEQETREILQWLPEFETLLKVREYRAVTCLTQPVYLVACCKYETNREKRKKCALTAHSILRRERVKRCYVMPYDEAFFGFLRDLVGSHPTSQT